MPSLDLTDIDNLQHLLGRAGIKPQHSSGQNFLICREVVEATLIGIGKTANNITELGAGLGTLTQALLGAGYNVRAIERDQKLAKLLKKNLTPGQKERLDLYIADLRDANWSWPTPYCLVGNIPYNLSGLIIRRITQLNPTPQSVILLVQKEVGERLTATVPNMSLIGVAVQLWGSAQSLVTVPAECFWPAPKVASQLVFLTPKSQEEILPLNKREEILKLAKLAFQQKRKQLGGVLPRITGLKATEIDKILKETGIRPEQRPQELSCAHWISLADRILQSKAL